MYKKLFTTSIEKAVKEMNKDLNDILPIYGVEHDAILSKLGDITVAYKVELPEIFTLSDQEYEAFHQAWIKAIKVLPVHCVLHKQDWFSEAMYKAHFDIDDRSFLSRSSERFFNERPYLDHHCYILLTRKPAKRKAGSSLSCCLTRRTIVPEETINSKHYHEFINHAGQFERILCDSGFVQMKRLDNNELIEFIYRYLSLQPSSEPLSMIRDIEFKNNLQVGENHLQIYTLADAEYLPSLCGSRISYDKYSTDRTKFSVGFASPVGQCCRLSHI